LIDVALIFCFLFVKQHLWGIPIFWLLDNLDNGRIYLLVFDIVLSQIMASTARSRQSSSVVKTSNQITNSATMSGTKNKSDLESA
jgi:hypothetical protein